MKIWLATIAMLLVATATFADPLTCNLTEYKASPGLSAAVADNVLTCRGRVGRRSEDGTTIISTTNLPPFGRHQFKIPFDATGKKWVRFAAWDVAGNGALVQPVKLSSAPTSAGR